MSGEKPQQSSTGLTQEEIEFPTIVKSVCLPPRLKFHFFQTSTDAVYPSELYRPDSVLYNSYERRIYRSWDFIERVCNVSEFVTKIFATMYCVLFPSATARDFKYPGEYGTLKITKIKNKPSWLPGADNADNQTAINIIPLLDGFSKILGQVDKQNSFFNFSLVSSNHAHNLPVAFAFYAFNNAMKHQLPKEEAGKYKRIVINFDYHVDTGDRGKPDDDVLGKQIKSASWGSALFYNKLHERAEFDFIADLYISIGIDGEKKVTYGTPKTGGSEREIKPVMKMNYDSVRTETKYKAVFQKYVRSNVPMKLSSSNFSLADIKDFRAVWEEIKKQAGVDETNKALAYITWDRDVGSDGYTDWTLIGGEPLDRNAVCTSICNCVELIKKDDGLVVGFDVTGMPDNLVTVRSNCVQRKILEQNLDVLVPGLEKSSEGEPAGTGGYFIVHKDDKDAFLGKATMTNHISTKARNYYFTMMKDISRVLLTLKDCDYLVHC